MVTTHKKDAAWKIEFVKRKYPGLYDLLGTVPDKELAVKYRLSVGAIRNMRQRLRIPITYPVQKGAPRVMMERREAINKAIVLIDNKKYAEARCVLLRCLSLADLVVLGLGEFASKDLQRILVTSEIDGGPHESR